LTTRLGMCVSGAGSWLCSGVWTCGSRGTQHAGELPGCRRLKKSEVHSQTFPVISNRPYSFGGNRLTGVVPGKPSALRFSHGNRPCQVLAIVRLRGWKTSPQQ
jgi:hypothetical protein